MEEEEEEDKCYRAGRGEELTVNGCRLPKQKINIICFSNQTELQVFTLIKSPKSF